MELNNSYILKMGIIYHKKMMKACCIKYYFMGNTYIIVDYNYYKI